MNDSNQIKDILSRIVKLEKAVFATGGKQSSKASVKPDNFTGPKGGILLLLTKGYFSTPRFATDVKEALVKHNYHYTIQAVQVALLRLCKTELVVIKVDGKKAYVKRK